MLVHTGSLSGPDASGTCSVSTARANGMSRQPNRAGPISTVTRPSLQASASMSPAGVSSVTRSAPLSRMRKRGDAACGIAAGLGLAAVGVADAHEGGGPRVLRLLDEDELIAADAAMAVGNGARGGRVDRDGVRARVEHDEVVAEPMHLDESRAVHGAVYRGGVRPCHARACAFPRRPVPAAEKRAARPLLYSCLVVVSPLFFLFLACLLCAFLPLEGEVLVLSPFMPDWLEVAAGGWEVEDAGGVVCASAGSAAIETAANAAARRESLLVMESPCPLLSRKRRGMCP